VEEITHLYMAAAARQPLPLEFDPETEEEFPGNYLSSPFTGTKPVGK